MRLVLITLFLGGCYNPTFPEGLACSEARTCPPGQSCLGDNLCHESGEAIVDASHLRDAPPDVATTACTTAPQGGCFGTEKCTAASSGGTVCAASGSVAIGGACNGLGATDNCAAGGICLFGDCNAFCSTTVGCGGSDVCLNWGNGTTMFEACTQSCDARTPTCPSTPDGPQGCYISGNTTATFVQWCAVSANNLAIGATCASGNDCVPGVGCIDAVCRRFCDFASFPNQQGPTCTAGQTCTALLGTTTVGSCK